MRLLNSSSYSAMKFLNFQKYKHNIESFRNFAKRTFSSVAASTNQSNSSIKEPEYIQFRLNLWNKYKAEHESCLKAKTSKPIEVRLHYGQIIKGLSWHSTPYQIFHEINKKVANEAIVAKVNNQLWDLDRPLESDCDVELLSFDDRSARDVFWHSSAHVLGAAMELIYGGLLYTGPTTEKGFYYDMFNFEKAISSKDCILIESQMRKIIKSALPFERIEVSKSDLMELFSYNKLKMQIIEQKITDDRATIYRCGSLVDLCAGPHIRNTGRIKAFRITNNACVQFEETKHERVYGVSFPSSDELKNWAKLQEEAAKRDHRKIGREQDLFFFHESSPGSCFFYPKGAHIYNTLLNFIKDEYRQRGFQEVITPNIFKSTLWKTSGHWDHYAENIFSFDTDKEKFVLKPMNCPGHCIMFANKVRSYRELPLRFADFGVLHRDEPSGGLTGLTRVRRFQQDDAHIFCTTNQIQSEIDSCLDFLSYVYRTLGFDFKLVLSTRPDSYLGDLDVWNSAESALENSLNKFGKPWKLNAGDGAFYGPKIDITITDALGRAHQCATIQLDFLLPQRFGLEYDAENDVKDTPVMIHRAIFGSLERFIAILTENFAGKWPFWLSPNQIIVVPVDPVFNEYADNVRQQLSNAKFIVEADLDSRLKISKKIRNAQLAQYNFILVVGEKERTTNTINVRTRDNKIHGQFSVDELISKLNKFRNEFKRDLNDF